MNQNLFAAMAFYFFAFVAISSAAVVVFSKNLVRSAFALLFTFFAVAALYAFAGADFLAAVQMVIYVGGILVLILFGVMLTHKLYELKLRSETVQFFPALTIFIIVFVFLAIFMVKTHWFHGKSASMAPTTAAIGEILMKNYVLPFEIASILLLIALIGAAMIVRRRSE